MLGRLFKKTETGPQPKAQQSLIDPLEGNATAHAWERRLREGQWREFGAFLREQSDIEERDYYLSTLSQAIRGWPAWVDRWVEEQPGDVNARLFRAWRYKDYAWEARGGGGANTVQRGAWDLFFSRLEAADADLALAADLAPDDAGPWALMVTTARGRQLGIPELRRRFAEADQRSPLHTLACRNVLQGVAAKWGGSHELMFELARGMSSRAPMGSPIHALIPTTHLEFWLQEQNNAYWQSPLVRQEIVEAGRKALSQPIQTPYLISTRNAFACCYWLLNEPALLAAQIQEINGIITRSPWHYFGQPSQIYLQAQARAAA